MTATYTFTAYGDTHDSIVGYAKRAADAYWGRTAYKVTLIQASTRGATVTTQALEAVAS